MLNVQSDNNDVEVVIKIPAGNRSWQSFRFTRTEDTVDAATLLASAITEAVDRYVVQQRIEWYNRGFTDAKTKGSTRREWFPTGQIWPVE